LRVEKGGKDSWKRKLRREETGGGRDRNEKGAMYRHHKLNASSSSCRKTRERKSIARQHKATQQHKKERERKNKLARHKVRWGRRK